LTNAEEGPDGRKSYLIRAQGSGPLEERFIYEVWQGAGAGDYHCHGWAFGHFRSAHGAFSLCTGQHVTRYVQHHFNPVLAHADVCKGTIVAWKDERGYIVHSAVVSEVFLVDRALDAAQATVITKNGDRPLDVMSLQEVHVLYTSEDPATQHFFFTPK
jgi:hypothetical protein